MAIDAKLADEQEDQYQAAVSAELAAMEAVNAAKQKEAAAGPGSSKPEADLKYAKAEVDGQKARLEKSEVLLDYTVIRSPYTGVVTKRNFHPGDFVRSADAGGDRVPVLGGRADGHDARASSRCRNETSRSWIAVTRPWSRWTPCPAWCSSPPGRKR